MAKRDYYEVTNVILSEAEGSQTPVYAKADEIKRAFRKKAVDSQATTYYNGECNRLALATKPSEVFVLTRQTYFGRLNIQHPVLALASAGLFI